MFLPLFSQVRIPLAPPILPSLTCGNRKQVLPVHTPGPHFAYDGVMSVRIRTRADGSAYSQVRYRLAGRETSISFDDHAEALNFDALVNKVGALKALEITKIVVAQDRGLTVGQWLNHHNDHLTGITAETLNNYRRYATKDFPGLVDIPINALTPDDVREWMQGLRNSNGAVPSGKTVANKHGYLAGALNAALERGHIKSNPCEHVRLPRTHREEMVFLEPDEYKILRAEIPDHWKPLVDFLVTSGARWSEATALRPQDVNKAAGTVRISRAWKKKEGGGYEVGPPKTKKSVRTINLPADVIAQLDMSNEYVFTNSGRGRHNKDGVVRNASFAPNVWHPAVARAQASGLLTKRPRIHDLRHTCASWLIQAGRPLPAVQAQLGHNSIVTTVSVYGHLDRSSGKGNADALTSLLKP
jgi:integrase